MTITTMTMTMTMTTIMASARLATPIGKMMTRR
jgi:hypothetical protein